ncbi:MAG: hypothetical protein SO135_02270 [Sphaerochaetaceae bacterium]|jgi:hypothetical protein|nr:hypothetical protein [Sphaerochaetaceae bacterium]
MNNKIVRIAILAFQIVISLAIFILLAIGFAGGEEMEMMVRLSIPCLIQTISNLIFSILLFFYYKKTNSLDLQMAPVLLLSTSLENIRIFAYFAEYSYREPISQGIIATIFLFSMLLSAEMFCGSSIIHQSRSRISVNNYIICGIIATIAILIFGPRVTDLVHLESIWMYMLLIRVLYICAVLGFIVNIIINPRRSNVIIRLAMIALSSGNFLLSLRNALPLAYTGTILFFAGEITIGAILLKASRKLDTTDITDQIQSEIIAP